MYVISRVADVTGLFVDWVDPLISKPPFQDHEVWAIYGRITLHLGNNQTVVASQPTQFIEIKPEPSINASLTGISWLKDQDSDRCVASVNPAFNLMWDLLTSLLFTLPPNPTLQDLVKRKESMEVARRTIEDDTGKQTIASYTSSLSFVNRLQNPLWLVLPEIRNTIMFDDRVWTWSDPLKLGDIFAFFKYVAQTNVPFPTAVLDKTVHEAFFSSLGKITPANSIQRPRLSESARHEVWRRDQGKCVSCGSKEKLEFDHIIPFSRGGADTARNLQLLCEACNRRKSATI